jgi:hypothetical protein
LIEVLLTKPVVVALAVLGAALCSLASFLQTRHRISEKTASALNWTGYAVMGASMLLFVLAGLWR